VGKSGLEFGHSIGIMFLGQYWRSQTAKSLTRCVDKVAHTSGFIVLELAKDDTKSCQLELLYPVNGCF